MEPRDRRARRREKTHQLVNYRVQTGQHPSEARRALKDCKIMKAKEKEKQKNCKESI